VKDLDKANISKKHICCRLSLENTATCGGTA